MWEKNVSSHDSSRRLHPPQPFVFEVGLRKAISRAVLLETCAGDVSEYKQQDALFWSGKSTSDFGEPFWFIDAPAR